MTQVQRIMHIVTYTILTIALSRYSHLPDVRVLMFVCAFIVVILIVWAAVEASKEAP